MKRHFTVTAFISAEGHTLLHWHAKNRMWLPPGGHIEPDEDPPQAVLREAREETGIVVAVLPAATPFPYDAPPQLPPPATIMVEEIPATDDEPAHQHLDLIYFTRPVDPGLPTATHDGSHPGWRWVSAKTLQAAERIAIGEGAPAVAPPQDVRVLGLAAIARADSEPPLQDD